MPECLNTDAEQRRRAARAGSGRVPDTRRRRPGPRSRRRSRPATDTSTPPLPTATSGRSERRSRSSGLDRSEVFLETKIWISDYGYDKTLHGFEKSARKLGVDQIDLLILHQALPSDFEATLEAYRALETLLADGKVRAIGVSNFMVDHLTTLLERATVVPAVNQIEVHPYFQQTRRAGSRRRARHPDPGLVPDRRHHLLPRRAAQQHPAGPGHRRHRHGPRQDSRSGHAALAPAAGPLGDPEVDQAAADRREHRRVRLRTLRRASSPRSTPSTPASAVGPSLSRSHWRASGARSPRTSLKQRQQPQTPDRD